MLYYFTGDPAKHSGRQCTSDMDMVCTFLVSEQHGYAQVNRIALGVWGGISLSFFLAFFMAG